MSTTSWSDKNSHYRELVAHARDAQTSEHTRAEAAMRTAKWHELAAEKRHCGSCKLTKKVRLSIYCQLKMKYVTSNNLCCFWKGTEEAAAKEIVWLG